MVSDRYSSPLRAENARRARANIRQSARELFSEQGFEATTVAQIAKRAGVSSATVYAAFESKGGIVHSLLQHLEGEVDMPARIAQMFAEPDPRRRLRLFVASNRAMFELSADVMRAAQKAMDNPAVAALQQAGDANRRGGCELIVGTAAEAGLLRADLTPSQAVEQMWLLTGGAVYLTATTQLAWSPDDYETWLGDLLERALLV